MYDSVNPARIPRDAEMVAGYVNGIYAWKDTDWALFPHAVHVGIAVRASYNGGEVLDVERGDAAPAEAPGWVLMRREAGIDPTIYCSESLWTTVAREFNNQGVVAPHYWIAHYDGSPDIPIGAVAKQYSNTPGWDVSSVADYWPGVDNLGGNVTISTADADVIINRLMEREIQVGPDGAPMRTVPYSALLRYIDDNASVARNAVTAENVRQWIADAIAGHITVTVSAS